jgi:hypothetical protein
MNTPDPEKSELNDPSTSHSILAAATKKAKFHGTDNPPLPACDSRVDDAPTSP